MSRKRYDMSLRSAAAEEARRRIVRAAAELHALHGALGTTHAMIAGRARVSLPTVYKYFPTRDHLIPACTGLVAAQAPAIDEAALFAGLERGPGRVKALADALFRRHAHFAPWSKWTARDAAELPALRRFLQEQTESRLRLVRAALPARASKSLVALAGILLDWPSYRTLTDEGLDHDQAARAAAEAVIALCRKDTEVP